MISYVIYPSGVSDISLSTARVVIDLWHLFSTWYEMFMQKTGY